MTTLTKLGTFVRYRGRRTLRAEPTAAVARVTTTRDARPRRPSVGGTLRAILLLGVGPIVAVAGTAEARTRPAVYEVARTAVPIRVDGALDEPVWAKAAVAELVSNADGSASHVKTEARLLYDDAYLYVAFRCDDENVWATMKKRDEHLWEEEVAEVFLQPDPAEPSYVELEVNPLGTMLDIYLLDVRKPLHYESWDSEKLKWAARVDGTVDGEGGDRAWTCEMAFPFEDAPTAPHTPPRPGDRWRMNLYRVDARPKPAEVAWSPTLEADFHRPNAFGELVFTDRVATPDSTPPAAAASRRPRTGRSR